MSAPSDKRKEMTPEKLDKLRRMREKRAENALARTKQKEEDLKQAIVQERAQPEQEVVEVDVEEEQEEVVQKPVRRKKVPAVFEKDLGYGYGKTADTVEYIRGIVQDVIDPPAERKARKWQARKAEIKQEILSELYEDESEDEEPSAPHVQPVRHNNLASMFEY